ncbi:MAG: DUF1365 family protein, partial [Verrucomicrobiota bacterium]
MNSCLYECHVMHARFSPRAHRFVYRIFLFSLDLDEVESSACRVPFFSLGRRNLYSYRDADFFPTGEGATLRDRVTAFAARHGADIAGARIVLVTLPRVVGYL